MSSQNQKSVLLYGRDSRLLHTRQMLLQRDGYRVWVATNLDEIDAISRVETVSLLMLCHSLTLQECGRTVAYCQSRWPLMKSLILTSPGSWCEAGGPHQVFDATQGPANLLIALEQLLQPMSTAHSHLY
jgi:DNA-binding NtrC family response regulator